MNWKCNNETDVTKSNGQTLEGETLSEVRTISDPDTLLLRTEQCKALAGPICYKLIHWLIYECINYTDFINIFKSIFFKQNLLY